MKRKVSPEMFRRIVRARITKGDAFRLNHADNRRQREVSDTLKRMTDEEIAKKYDYAVYDIEV